MCLEGCESKTTRREFLASTGATLGGVVLGDKISGQETAKKALDGPNVSHESVNFYNEEAKIEGFLARPKKAGRFRAVIVTHGNAGLPEDVRNTAAQLAQAGFFALAVNPTSRYPDMSKSPRESLRTNEFGAEMMRDIRAGVKYLKTQSSVKAGGVGIVGYCGGGIVSLMMAALSREIDAVVALYAAPFVSAEQNSLADSRPHMISFVEWVKAPVQAHFGTAVFVCSAKRCKSF